MLDLCPVCKNANITREREAIWSCADCSHMFQNPPEVGVTYDQKYIADRYDSYTTGDVMSHLRLGIVKSFVGQGTLLDVGYGNGAFIKLAVKAGYDAYGHDVHGQGEKYGVRDAKLDPDRSWDVVTLFDSLEHFPDLDVIRPVLAKAFLVVVTIPARPPTFPTDLEWRHYRPGEHLHYFSFSSICEFLKPKQLRSRSDAEDVIRLPKRCDWPNTMTMVFNGQMYV